jgi:type III restriction enzyme
MRDSNKDLSSQIKEIAFDYRISKPEIPAYVIENIRHNLWQWQKEALENFLTWEKVKEIKNDFEPTHLMFNMATGTGKTMVMGALILYYYKKGYRNFIFFVNQNNIVDKTENNFINKNHTKYLFRQNIIIDDKIVNIRKVETFDETDDIQIKFTSIHKLHNAVYLEKENSVTLSDLQKRDLIMLGDEAHNFNASTKKNGKQKLNIDAELRENASAEDIERSWENTIINKILKREKDKQEKENRNVLLEFTATIPKIPAVIEKYRTKTIYKFELADFLRAGYTKEINLVSTSLNKKEKILLALLFNWYRHRIALKYIDNFKPVILFRSKFIEESKNDYEEFLSLVSDLKSKDFDFLKNIEQNIKQDDPNSLKIYEQGKSRIKQMLGFIKKEKINFQEIADYIKYEFTERNCIITNSKSGKAKGQRGGEKTTNEQNDLLNNLEDKNNHIRAIFTVKRLTEGWDVLNLFDIVRLYQGRDEGHEKNTGKRKAGETTVQEIQLIGRGVRYFPFEYNDCEKNKRKFDEELQNPLRVLEEFYYHSSDTNTGRERRYIDELKRELKEKGLINDDREKKTFALKKEFKDTPFFKEIKVWKNKRTDNPEKRKKDLSDLKKDSSLNPFECSAKELFLKTEHINLDQENDETTTETIARESKTLNVELKKFEKHIIAKAINKIATKDLSLLRFDNLQNELNINSVEEIIKDNFIGDFKINIKTSKDNFDDIGNEEKLEILLRFFDEFIKKLKEIANPYIGTDFKPLAFQELFGEPKEKSININKYDKSFEKNVLENKWYVLNGFVGTSEEVGLFEFLKDRIGNLAKKYKDVYLLRNEEIYKIYDFNKGRGFEPDFLLFLKGNKGKSLYYQIFIESKGDQFKDKEGEFKESKEGWKEKFLQRITDKYGNGELLKAENKDYKLIGLPLFNEKNKNDFEKAFNKQLLK